MKEVTLEALQNKAAAMIERVHAGEQFVVTRAGRPVAELRPVLREPLDRGELLARWRSLPAVDLEALRRDLDQVLDP
ncbi:MAG: type II toxin-antitoxin system prevent-host-death family antitoxin [Acidobacteria bacterium]|nr:type II toxin-antitoxin system prevent-host-death family antitoxin [Acidobacteriota bacterium]